MKQPSVPELNFSYKKEEKKKKKKKEVIKVTLRLT